MKLLVQSMKYIFDKFSYPVRHRWIREIFALFFYWESAFRFNKKIQNPESETVIPKNLSISDKKKKKNTANFTNFNFLSNLLCDNYYSSKTLTFFENYFEPPYQYQFSSSSENTKISNSNLNTTKKKKITIPEASLSLKPVQNP